MNLIKTVNKLGQSIWLDFIQRDMINNGQLKRLIDEGLTGVTSNPTIFHKAISQSNAYDDAIRTLLKSNPDIETTALYEQLAIRDIQAATDLLRHVYDTTDGMDGLVSIEVSPYLADDTERTIAEARRLWQMVNRPNLLVKVPATSEGIPAIELLTAEGININITLMFSMKHYELVSRAYIKGITRNPNPRRVTSVASFFVSRVDTYVDKELDKIGTKEALALRGKAAVANSKVVYRRLREVFDGEFSEQRKRGARTQRLVWGSTSTKNPAYSHVLYVDELIGPDTVNTMPLETLDAFRKHGKAERSVDRGIEKEERVLDDIRGLGVNLDAITEQIQKDGVKAFADSLDQLLAALDEKRKKL